MRTTTIPGVPQLPSVTVEQDDDDDKITLQQPKSLFDHDGYDLVMLSREQAEKLLVALDLMLSGNE
jgi:hypothetical protein